MFVPGASSSMGNELADFLFKSYLAMLAEQRFELTSLTSTVLAIFVLIFTLYTLFLKWGARPLPPGSSFSYL